MSLPVHFVVVGQPLSGKSQILIGGRRVFGGKLDSYELPPDSYGLRHSVLRLRVRIEEVECEVSTVPGTVMSWSVWSPLLASAHGILLALDPTPGREAKNFVWVSTLALLSQPIVGCVASTKQDLIEGCGQNLDVLDSLDSILGDYELFFSRIDQLASLVAPLRYLARRVRE